jgi:SecD/SecF fusion protein
MRLRLLASLGVFLWSVGVLFPRNGEIIRRGLDLRGGTAVTLEIAKESLAENVQDRANQLKKVVEIMGKRVDALGVSEPIIRARGNAQVEVQLADVFAVNNRDLINVIKKPAKLEFRLLHEHTVGEDSDLLPPGYEFIPHEFMDEETGVMQSRPVLVRRVPELGGAAIRRASAVVNSYGVHEVSLELTADGAKKFERITRRNVGKSLGIVLDGKLYSAPVIRSVISDGHAAISGNFTQKSATDLANILNNPLEFELRVVEVRELGPTLAKEVQSSSMKAAYIGSASVMVFMLLCNVVGGLVSIISILFNVLIILAVLVTIGGTMTLPAIAALVLTIGMGVDSNIITYARMREEISQKKSMEKAVKFGFERAFVSIMDANLTTLLTAAVLIFYGMGSIRGFGIILAIGIISNLFCSLVFTRGALEFLQNISLLRSFSFPQWKNHIHFMHMRKIAIIISLPLLIATVWQTHARGQDIYGIDFRGGEEYVLTFGEPPLLESITQAAERANIREVVSSFQRSIRDGAEELKLQLPIGKGEELLEALEEAMPQCHFRCSGKPPSALP